MSAMALATAEEAQVAGASSGCVVMAATDASLEIWSTGVPSPFSSHFVGARVSLLPRAFCTSPHEFHPESVHLRAVLAAGLQIRLWLPRCSYKETVLACSDVPGLIQLYSMFALWWLVLITNSMFLCSCPDHQSMIPNG